MKSIDYSLYLVTDSSSYEEQEFLSAIKIALQNGVTLLQLREKEATSRAFLKKAIQVKKLTDQYHVPLVINDRIDIALAVNADGVHLGQNDIPVKDARRIMGPNKLIGASAKTVEQALEAEKHGANYLGTGAMNPTTTKVITQITSFSTLTEICNAVKIPVVAIGGISKENLWNLKGANIKGIAVVSAILSSSNIQVTTQSLAKEIQELLIESQNIR